MVDGHNDAIREQFRAQAATFTDVGFAARGLDWIVEQVAVSPGHTVLDVAAGAAHLGRALAPHVLHVTALDLTPEMLEQGRRLAAAAALRNIAFVVGDATSLPWRDDQFDLVVCRLTLHQVADPPAVVSEMVRVARPSGQVVIVDMTVDDDPAQAAETNRLERLRDPSHGRTLTLGEIHRLLADAGVDVVSTAGRDQALDVEDWLQRTGTPIDVRAEIRYRFEREIEGGEATGLRPHRDGDGALVMVHPWSTIIAAVGRRPLTAPALPAATTWRR